MHWCISDSALLATLSTEPIEWIKIETDKRGTSVVTPEPGGRLRGQRESVPWATGLGPNWVFPASLQQETSFPTADLKNSGVALQAGDRSFPAPRFGEQSGVFYVFFKSTFLHVFF